MNLINKILILIIILFLINYLTSGKIFETIKGYLNSCVEKFSNTTTNKACNMDPHLKQIPYASQTDFQYNMNNDMDLDAVSYNLYQFISTRVTNNSYAYEMVADGEDQHDVPKDMQKYILDSLTTMFNQSGFEFKNIKILDKLYYFDNMRGKDIIPFNFSADVSYNKTLIGKVIVNIESYIYEKIKGGEYAIINTRLIRRINPNLNKKEKKLEKSLYRVDKPEGNIKDTNDFFIKNDEDEFDIPDIKLTELDDYEFPSINNTSEQQ